MKEKNRIYIFYKFDFLCMRGLKNTIINTLKSIKGKTKVKQIRGEMALAPPPSGDSSIPIG